MPPFRQASEASLASHASIRAASGSEVDRQGAVALAELVENGGFVKAKPAESREATDDIEFGRSVLLSVLANIKPKSAR